MHFPTSAAVLTVLATIAVTVQAVPIQQMENNQFDYVLTPANGIPITGTSAKV